MNIQKLRKKLDNKEISAVELTKEYLKRIKENDDKVDAFLYINEENALEMAQKAQKQIDEKKAGALTGIPIAIKDNICTTDMPTTCGSKMLEGYISPYDAVVIQKLRNDNAILVGKVNLDEFAMGSTTKTSYYKKTKNPFNFEHVPGGSSGGSAAAVSAGFCVGALGSDTGGSVRQPASFCGVTGHRPTYGTVSRYGCVAFASSLDQIGPIANSAKDCASILSVISGDGINDQTSVKNSFKADGIFDESIKGKKIGIISELMGDELSEDVRVATENAIRWYKDNGAIIEHISLPMLKYAVPAYYLISSAEASANLSRFDGIRYGHRNKESSIYNDIICKSRAEGFGWEVKRRIMLGSYALCSGYYDAYYKKAIQLTNVVKAEYLQAFIQYDALLSPVFPTVAPKFDDIPADPAKVYIADICTVSAALAGIPSISTPCGYDKNGMPIGLMITGNRFEDGKILNFADKFESDFKAVKSGVNVWDI